MSYKTNMESFKVTGVKDKIYFAVCGMPDCGKSTFIKTLIEYITHRNVDIDSFCNEQILDRTIRSSQIILRDKKLKYDYVFLDCPGHIDDYPEEVESAISKCHIVLNIIDYSRLDKSIQYLEKLQPLFDKYNKTIVKSLISHCNSDDNNCYDAKDSTIEKFHIILKQINEWTNDWLKEEGSLPTNPVETAIRIIKQAVEKAGDRKSVAMCSFGKDSLALLQLFKLANVIDKVKIEFPVSGFDLPGINDEFINRVKRFFGCEIEPFRVIEEGWDFENHSVQDMMLCKARMLTERVKENNYYCVFTGIRRDEEGTRAKEKFFSPRNPDGSYDCYKSQLEVFGNECTDDIKTSFNIRVNPLLDLTEADIWYMTKYFNIPYCEEYISKDGKRYRSLGDWPITTPIDSNAKTIDEICEEVDVSLIPERACRAKQDKSVKFGMEKLRSKGFF